MQICSVHLFNLEATAANFGENAYSELQGGVKLQHIPGRLQGPGILHVSLSPQPHSILTESISNFTA